MKRPMTLLAASLVMVFGSSALAEGVLYYSYLQGNITSGAHTYINSGLCASGDMRYEAEVEWTTMPTDNGFLGAKENNSNRHYIFYAAGTSSSAVWKIAAGGGIEDTACAIVLDRKVKVEAKIAAGEQYLKVDGATVWSGSAESVAGTTQPLFVMAYNYNNGQAWGDVGAKLYSLKIWRKNAVTGEYELVRDYLPASETVSGTTTYGLYDRVEKRMYGAANGSYSRSSMGKRSFPHGTPHQRLAYVDAAKNAYVDTGIRGKTGLECELDYALRGSSEGGVLAACNGSWAQRIYLAAVTDKGNYSIGYGAHLSSSVAVGTCERKLVRSRLRDGEQFLEINGNRIVESATAGEVDAGCNLFLFTHDVGGSYSNPYLTDVRFFGGRIWRYDSVGGTNVLVRDFHPCLVEGEAALYDTVEDEYYLSNTTSPLLAGPRLRAPRHALKYVEASGDVSIDTEVAAKAGVEVEADVEWVASPSDNYILAAKSMDGVRMFMIGGQANGGNRWCFSYGNNYFSDVVETGRRYKVCSKMEAGSQVFKLDDSEKLNLTVANGYDLGQKLFLFALNQNKPMNYAKARVYSMKIRVKNARGDYELLRDFVPAESRDGEVGLWDDVSKRLFMPSEIGKSLVASDVKTPWRGLVVIVQ